MEKYYLCDVLDNRARVIFSGDKSTIFRLSDGQVLKLFSPFYLQFLRRSGIDIEKKIMFSESIKDVSGILMPTGAVYDERLGFVAYMMPEAIGKNFNSVDDDLSLSDSADLYRYAKIYSNLENIVKRTPNIVFPDLCTCDNIFLADDLSVQMIDYDDLQVGDYKTVVISSSLGDPNQYTHPKYFRNGLYTKNLDKKSLIILYFIDTFHVDLNKVGSYNPFTGGTVDLDYVFSSIGLEDYDVMDKVWKVFQNHKENEYLGDDLFHIAEDYHMLVYPKSDGRGSIKQLVRK